MFLLIACAQMLKLLNIYKGITKVKILWLYCTEIEDNSKVGNKHTHTKITTKKTQFGSKLKAY
jgi:hypothetical protein